MGRTAIFLFASHLVALGLAWWVAERGGDPGIRNGKRTEQKTIRDERLERRVPAEDLIAAYGDPQSLVEAPHRRRLEERAASERAPLQDRPSPEERAAQVTDIPGTLQERLDALNRNKNSDHQFTKALVARWMKEDSEVCAAWLGQINMRVGWRDPFDAFAKSKPAHELLDFIDKEGWLEQNRNQALREIAGELGRSGAEAIPGVIERLEKVEVEPFLREAVSSARVEDAESWMALLGENRTLATKLAGNWIYGPGARWEWRDGELRSTRSIEPDWEDRAMRVLAAAEGTPLEEVFRQQWEREKRDAEFGRLLKLAGRDPDQATRKLLELEMVNGRTEEEAREIVQREVAEIEKRYTSDRVAEWRRVEWERALQERILRGSGTGEALGMRLDQIETELPELLQTEIRETSFSESMWIDPEATLTVAVERGMEREIVELALKLMKEPPTPLSVQAEILTAIHAAGLWETDQSLEEFAVGFGDEYRKEDPEVMRDWVAGLPSGIAGQLKGEGR